MGIRFVRMLIVITPCLIELGGCSSSAQVGDLWTANRSEAANAPAAPAGDTTGSVPGPPAAPVPNGQPSAPLEPAHLGNDTRDDRPLANKYFRSNNYDLAEKAYRSALEMHPRDAEAWVGLAACYDRLRRFDQADRAYQEAIRIVGPTAEILNSQGFSYMLRGDYTRAQKKLEEAEAKDPANPYVQTNMHLLGEAYREGKAVP